MPKLRDLEAEFVIRLEHGHRQRGVTFAESQGLWFLCPLCFQRNGGPIGTHAVLCWFRGRGVPDDETPGPGRWTPAGTGIDDLSFVPGDPPMAHSVQLTPPQPSEGHCAWHGFVTNGEAA